MFDSTDPFHLCFGHCYAREATYEDCRADCHNPEQKTPDDTVKSLSPVEENSKIKNSQRTVSFFYRNKTVTSSKLHFTSSEST